MQDKLGDPPLPYARLDHTHSINIESEPLEPVEVAPTPATVVGLRILGLIALMLAIFIEVTVVVGIINNSAWGWNW